jgi:hypothetical protein
MIPEQELSIKIPPVRFTYRPFFVLVESRRGFPFYERTFSARLS